MDHGGSAGRSLRSFKRRPAAALTQLGRRVDSCPAATAAIRLVPLSCSLLRRQIMQGYAHPGKAAPKSAQRARHNLHRPGRRVTDVDFRPKREASASFFHRVRGALKNVVGFAEKNLSSHRQSHRFAAPFKQGKTDFGLEVVDLAADARLRDVKFGRSARNILLLGYGNKVTEMAKFIANHNQ
jgi:hypothetical protein